MFHRFPIFLLLLAAFATTMPNSVEARYMAHYKTKGVSAGASASINVDDCTYEYFSIDGSPSALKEKTNQGKATTTYNKFTYAYYSFYDYCLGVDTYGFVEVYPSTFVGDKNGATASATITSLTTCHYKQSEVDYFGEYICEDSPVELTIDATWVATGVTVKDRYTTSYGNKMFSSKYRYSGTTREATITLKVTKSGEPLYLDPSSISGYLYTSMTGEMSVDRYEY